MSSPLVGIRINDGKAVSDSTGTAVSEVRTESRNRELARSRAALATARRSAMRNSGGVGAGGRCHSQPRSGESLKTRRKSRSETRRKCRLRRRTRPTNQPANRMHRAETPAWPVDLSRRHPSMDARALVWGFHRMAWPDRPASDRVSTAADRDRSANAPNGYSPPGLSPCTETLHHEEHECPGLPPRQSSQETGQFHALAAR